MEHASAKNSKIVFHDYETLQFAEYFSPTTVVINQITLKHYLFRKYCLAGNWGICNSEKTKKVVREKPTYTTAAILSYAQFLVAGDSNVGWDVFSLEGKFLRHLPPMSLDGATNYLNARRRSNL